MKTIKKTGYDHCEERNKNYDHHGKQKNKAENKTFQILLGHYIFQFKNSSGYQS